MPVRLKSANPNINYGLFHDKQVVLVVNVVAGKVNE